MAAEAARYVRPLGRPNVYLRADAPWPTQLASLRTDDHFLMLVLSTSCTTCNAIGEQLGQGDWTAKTDGRLALVLSTPDEQLAEDFIAKNGLAGLPHFIDLNGDWSEAALGLSLSPVGLIFTNGDLVESYVINHVEPLWTTYLEVTEWNQHQHPTHLDGLPGEASSAPSVQVV